MITAIIPFYNASKTIERAIKSILNQTLKPEKIIVVDDYSTKEESNALGLIAEKYGIYVIKLTKNSGPSAARNMGWSAAKTKYIAFLDSDDTWSSNKLEICINYMEKNHAHIVGHQTATKNIGPNVTIHDLARPHKKSYILNKLDILVSTSQYAPSTVVINNQAIAQRFDETIRRSEDYRLWGNIHFGGHNLHRIKFALTTREDAHISGSGLSGNKKLLLEAHQKTINFFQSNGHISKVTAIAAKIFLKLKYLRHK